MLFTELHFLNNFFCDEKYVVYADNTYNTNNLQSKTNIIDEIL